nr:hypothetical protein [Gilliamella sp. B2824]
MDLGSEFTINYLLTMRSASQVRQLTCPANLNYNRAAYIKAELLQPPAFNGQLWSWVGFCVLWHVTHGIKPLSGLWLAG